MIRNVFVLCALWIGFSSFIAEVTKHDAIPSFEIRNDTIYGKVVAITDGDTFKLLTKDSILHRIRIANIDCPEKKQAFSKRAKQFTSEAIFGKEVSIEVLSKDRYGRLIANVLYHDGLILNEELLKSGFAWHYKKYSKDTHLQSLEDEARLNKLGLWQDNMAIPPWEWRANKKKKPKKNN